MDEDDILDDMLDNEPEPGSALEAFRISKHDTQLAKAICATYKEVPLYVLEELKGWMFITETSPLFAHLSIIQNQSKCTDSKLPLGEPSNIFEACKLMPGLLLSDTDTDRTLTQLAYRYDERNKSQEMNEMHNVKLSKEVCEWLQQVGLQHESVTNKIVNNYQRVFDNTQTSLRPLVELINSPNITQITKFWRIIQAHLCANASHCAAAATRQDHPSDIIKSIGFTDDVVAKLVNKGTTVHSGLEALTAALRYDLVETVMGLIRWQFPELTERPPLPETSSSLLPPRRYMPHTTLTKEQLANLRDKC